MKTVKQWFEEVEDPRVMWFLLEQMDCQKSGATVFWDDKQEKVTFTVKEKSADSLKQAIEIGLVPKSDIEKQVIADAITAPDPIAYLRSYLNIRESREPQDQTTGQYLGGLEKRNGEFTEESQHIAFDSPQSLQTLVEDMSKFPYKQAMIFTSSIKSAGIVASMMPDCVEVHTGVENADFNLWRFKSGEVRHCISVGSLTKGFDHPPVDLVVLWRATTSLPLYLQMICW